MNKIRRVIEGKAAGEGKLGQECIHNKVSNTRRSERTVECVSLLNLAAPRVLHASLVFSQRSPIVIL